MGVLLQPILVSIIAGLFILVLPKTFRKMTEGFSLVTSLYLLAASIRIFLKAPIEADFLYVDSLSRFIALGIGFFGALVTLYSTRSMSSYKDVSSYYACVIWTIGISLLASVSNNVILLIAAWGFLGLLLYTLINVSGARSAAISKKTLIIVAGSDGFMILGFALLWRITGSLSLSGIRVEIDNPLSFWAFLFIAIGAFAKAGAMPFHSWIPDTAKEAPITVTAFLPASLDKLLGIYLLARLVMNVFVLDNFSRALLMIIGVITIMAGAMAALVQNDFKKLLSFCAISQVGYIVLGIGTGSVIGLAGGLFHMVNHAIYKSCLFLSCGNVEYRANDSDLDRLGGFAKMMPLSFMTALTAFFAMSGIPPFNGFFSKWMIYQALVEKGSEGGVLWIFCLVAAMFGSGLAVAASVKLINGVFLGPRKHGLAREVPWQMWLPVVILAVLCIVFGVFAYIVPLRYLIIPVLPGGLAFIGAWPSIKAALFLLTGLGAGVLICFMGNFKGVRESPPYIGGEEISDEMRLSGTEFYNTVKEHGMLRGIYKKAETGFFDIYEQGKNITLGFGRFFQYLHNGVLPTYLVWALLGMMGLFLFLVK
ncbi:MAG: proton-conducting transporter membrane subunit [Candidatus Omnitrophota bacterium]